MNQYIKETLEKQLQILSERSIRERGEILPELTRVMLNLAQYLEGAGYDTLSDLVAIEVNKQLDEHDTELAESLNASIKEIAREEISAASWRPLWSEHPELARALQKEFPALVPDLRAVQTPTDSRQEPLPNP